MSTTNRGATPAALAAIGADENCPIHLFEMYLDGETIHATDAGRTVIWGGNTYIANGQFLNFEGVEETADLQIQDATVTLSGVDQSFIALILSYTYIDRRLVIRKAFMTDENSAITDPVLIFDGRMDSPSINDDPQNSKCEVTVKASSHFGDFQRVAGRHTNFEDSQIYFPGDTGFAFVSQGNTTINWGGPASGANNVQMVTAVKKALRFS